MESTRKERVKESESNKVRLVSERASGRVGVRLLRKRTVRVRVVGVRIGG